MRYSFTLGVLLAIGLTSCDAIEEDPTIYHVGVVLSLTGPQTSNGVEILAGIQLAQEEILNSALLGEAELELTVYDDKSIPDTSLHRFARLIEEDDVPVILGPTSSAAARAITSTIDNHGVVALSPNSAALGLGAATPYLFRSLLTVERVIPIGIVVSHRHLNYTRVGTIVNEADAFSQSSYDQVIATLARFPDVSVVEEISYERDPSSSDVPDISAALSAMDTAGVDAIFVCGLSPDRIGVLMQAHAAGITDIPLIAPYLSISDAAQLNRMVPGAAEGVVTFHVWLAASTHPRSLTFLRNYRDEHGEEASDYVARGYVAMNVLANALAQIEAFEADEIRNALARTRDLDTVFGSFSFDEHGDALYDPVVARMQDGAFVLFE